MIKRISSGIPACLILSLLAACSLPVAKTEVTAPARPTQTGVASWYGPGFHGKLTASGSVYDQHDLTAAHQTLPLGTRVMVVNVKNGRSTEVTINDRGPFAKGRIIDLSYAAAQSLGMVGSGTVPVRIEVIDSPARIEKIRDRLDYTLQIGSFADMENAARLKDRLGKGFAQPSEVMIVPFRRNESTYYRVQAGIFSSRSDAEAQAKQFVSQGLPVVIMER
jgi:rare lipoprotein A